MVWKVKHWLFVRAIKAIYSNMCNYRGRRIRNASYTHGRTPRFDTGTLSIFKYINDVANFSNVFQPIMYADDITLVANLSTFYINNGLNIDININNELALLSDWLKLNRLSLNGRKTKFMIFHTPQKVVPRLILKMNNIELEPITDFNFLGIIINKHLRWKIHINKISINIARTTGIIRG